jgi:hypothetical protein
MNAPAMFPERLGRGGDVFRGPAAHIHLGAALKQTAAQAKPYAGGGSCDDRHFVFIKAVFRPHFISHIRSPFAFFYTLNVSRR